MNRQTGPPSLSSIDERHAGSAISSVRAQLFASSLADCLVSALCQGGLIMKIPRHIPAPSNCNMKNGHQCSQRISKAPAFEDNQKEFQLVALPNELFQLCPAPKDQEGRYDSPASPRPMTQEATVFHASLEMVLQRPTQLKLLKATGPNMS